MIARRIAVVAVAAFALSVAWLGAQPPAVRASAPIYQALDAVQSLSDASFAKVVAWARSGAPTVFAPVWDYERAEAGIAKLPSRERDAVLDWLRGRGRHALYRLGLTDRDIGPRRPGADYANATPTPNPWRRLDLTTTSLDARAVAQGNISILGGFAAAERSGKGVIACVSFRNLAAKTATRVDVAFTLINDSGASVGTLTLERRGEFSPNVDIMTYGSFEAWGGGQGIGPRGYRDNCVTRSNGVAALPILEARFVTYRIARVDYSDGTSWTP